jgi:predicted nucleic acid-binding protein
MEIDAPSHVEQEPSLPQAFDEGWLQAVEDPAELAPGPGRGERAAIALVLQLRADLLLVDDLDARKKAVAAGITITGTIGVLRLAQDEGLITMGDDIIARLIDAGFHSSPALLALLQRRE